ncbi:MAG: 16S rRNA (adenine(1518)-N(6)/adenine(1519)-N(6))-dimethyltransferase RsmA [Candidatus Thioglobus sp.]|jgi:16S rRNA (adenine1518-N6/adenine1519-N6)-dimethyltransferase|nr:16S rRNA (adenine(1518)-N(6)/adenine(1519)-N(6))-dimethyltransferase RsmA [Candidatus Thioglobus sp.]|tara:strand:+ start:1274 stop:2029 length:756 start_codon:yes stop_codon:yes gene_type:complete
MPHKARKRFGQNFLTDRQVIERIVSTISPNKEDDIVEIGPGKGAITFPLLEQLDKLNVVEIDRDLIALLQSNQNTKLIIHEADALSYDFSQISNNLRVVGNLPYNISSPLLFHLLSQKDNIIDMTFMLQKEVVGRIVAKHNCKDFGRLSVMMQSFFDVDLIFTVPKESFSPQPKIESAIVYLKTKQKPLIDNVQLLEKVVKVCFSKRRKTLKNCLKSYLNQEQTEIDLSQRAEMLSVESFITLTKDYAKQH